MASGIISKPIDANIAVTYDSANDRYIVGLSNAARTDGLNFIIYPTFARLQVYQNSTVKRELNIS